jgi:hypothetical protein
MPLVKEGRLTALMAIHDRVPRQWTEAELSLLREVTARSWAHVERVGATAELRASEGRFRAAVDAVQGVLWTNNAAGEMEGEQPGWAGLTGQSFEEYRGYGWAAAVHPDDAESTIAAWNAGGGEQADLPLRAPPAPVGRRMAALLDPGHPDLRRGRRDCRMGRRPYRHHGPRGCRGGVASQRGPPARGIRTSRGRLCPNRPDRPLPAGERPLLHDRGALTRAQEALRQSQKMEAMGQLTGGVAHDFNNLLTPIIGSLDMLQRAGLGSERERRLIDGALQSAERAKTLVQRLLAFARRQPLQPVRSTSAARRGHGRT